MTGLAAVVTAWGRRVISTISGAMTAWGETNLVHYYWRDGSCSEFDTAKRQFTKHHPTVVEGAE